MFRLDAGTFGTMGIGLPSAVAAALWCQDNAPKKKVICIQGDSAFGFSAMEMETINRQVLSVYIYIIVKFTVQNIACLKLIFCLWESLCNLEI